MNSLLLVAIVASAAAGMALLTHSISRGSKFCKPTFAVLLAIITLFTGSTLVYAAKNDDGDLPDVVDSSTTNPSASESKDLTIIYAFMASGDLDRAKELLDEYEMTTMYSEDYALCRARLAAFNRNYIGAKLLYEKSGAKLTSGDIGDEYNKVCACLLDTSFDATLIGATDDYAPSVENAEALHNQAKAARAELDDVLLASLATLLGKSKAQKYVQAAELIKNVDQLYSEHLNSYNYDESRAMQLMEEAADLAKNKAIASEPCFRLARIKLFILTKDFSGLAGSLSEASDYNELLVVTELYINGFISETDFAKKYGTDRIKIYKNVYNHLDALSEEVFSKRVKKEVFAFLNEMEEKMDHPGLTMMEDTLIRYAEDITVEDRTKIYLELAKYERFNEDDVQTNAYLTSALNTVTDCNDSVYLDAMCELVNIINDKDNPESMKNIANYVEDITKNSTTVKLADYLMEKNPEADTPDEESKDEVSFENYIGDYVSKKRASLNILNVDTSNFSEVSFTVGVDSEIAYSAEELEKLIKITDCGIEISDFTVEDITYSTVNMVLVCDASGSMSGQAIRDLKSAVSMFVNNKQENENIGLIVFDSYVTDSYGLDTSVEELNAAISNIYANGGTNIYDAVVSATSMLTGKSNALNIILLLSDGQDNYSHDESEINANVIQPCLKENTLIYSLGLGNGVDSNYLDSFAAPTGGSYLHIGNSATLASFYSYIHSMALNRYKVTFTAKDTLRYSRTLKVQSNDDELAYDTFKYKIGEDGSENESEDSSAIGFRNCYVQGLATREIFADKKDQTISLMGKGFNKDDTIEVELIGKLNYTLKVTYISETEYKVIVPGNIMKGVYDLRVTLNENEGYFPDELAVGDEILTTTFGPYKFTSMFKETDKYGNTILSGKVTMNGWLCFNGKITLQGVLDSSSFIRLIEEDGSYIEFDDNATGLAKTYVDNNMRLDLPSMGGITLYQNPDEDADSPDFEIEANPITVLVIEDFMEIKYPEVYVYPDYIRVTYERFTTNFPFQKKIITSLSGKDSFFEFSHRSDLFVSSKNMGTKIEFKYESSGDDRELHPAKLGNFEFKLAPNDVELMINSFKEEYRIKFAAKFDFFDFDGFGFEVEWTADLGLKKVLINVDYEFKTKIGPVPASVSNFWIGADDIDTSKPVILWTLIGKMDVEIADATELIPGIDLFFDDAPIVELADAGVELALGKGYVEISTDVKFLGSIDVGSITLTAGKMTYSNALLGLTNETAYGFRGAVECDIDINLFVLKGGLYGTQEVSLTNKLFGLYSDGDGQLELSVLGWNPAISGETALLIGICQNKNGKYVLSIAAVGGVNSHRLGFRVDFGASWLPVFTNLSV